MKTFSAAVALVMLTGTAAFAQQPMSRSVYHNGRSNPVLLGDAVERRSRK
jgi:hypothetical protein